MEDCESLTLSHQMCSGWYVSGLTASPAWIGFSSELFDSIK